MGAPSIPRLYCWGLIEAFVSSSIVILAMGLFPGFIAGASLKLTSPLVSLLASLRLFPGFIAGASLKRRVIRRRVAGRRGLFPGFIAGASLKPNGKQTRHRPHLQPIPRLYCWGLIEARSPPLDATSRSSIPRLYCWGLIEATSIAPGAGLVGPYSPALLLGPH